MNILKDYSNTVYNNGKNALGEMNNAYRNLQENATYNDYTQTFIGLYNKILPSHSYGITFKNPKNYEGYNGERFLVDGFKLDVIHNEKINLQTNITDYVLESGNTINLTNTLQPKKFSVTGVVGELVYKSPNDLFYEEFITEKFDKIDKLSGTLGKYKLTEKLSPRINNVSNSVKKRYDNINKKMKYIRDVIDDTKDTLNDIMHLGEVQEGHKEFDKYKIIEIAWKEQLICDIDTGWKFPFKNFVIDSVDWGQGDFLHRSEVTIVFKEIAYTKTGREEKKEKKITNQKVKNKTQKKVNKQKTTGTFLKCSAKINNSGNISTIIDDTVNKQTVFKEIPKSSNIFNIN